MPILMLATTAVMRACVWRVLGRVCSASRVRETPRGGSRVLLLKWIQVEKLQSGCVVQPLKSLGLLS